MFWCEDPRLPGKDETPLQSLLPSLTLHYHFVVVDVHFEGLKIPVIDTEHAVLVQRLYAQNPLQLGNRVDLDQALHAEPVCNLKPMAILRLLVPCQQYWQARKAQIPSLAYHLSWDQWIALGIQTGLTKFRVGTLDKRGWNFHGGQMQYDHLFRSQGKSISSLASFSAMEAKPLVWLTSVRCDEAWGHLDQGF